MVDFRPHALFWMVAQILQIVGGEICRQNLGGDDWIATGSSPSSTSVIRIPKATVPGCVQTDWFNHIGHAKEHDPFYRFNDGQWRSIADKNWLYESTFSMDQNLARHKEQWLICEGLDTIANISVNSKYLGASRNMFVRQSFNVTGLLQNNFNSIKVSFESATVYANKSRKSLKYPIPPECPPDVQHGFCHVNLLRKEQSSFSWDWGPGFASQGIWRPIYLIGIDEAWMTDVSLSYDWDTQEMMVNIRCLVTGAAKSIHGTISIFIDELSIHNASHKIVIDPASPSTSVLQSISRRNLTLWWPNGQGEQKLYNVTILFETDGSIHSSSKTLWFGFRQVELVQTHLNESTGLSFYFKINGAPLFAKGSNWIPADAFPSRVSKDNYTNLLQSAKDANMNMLRVWGGGIYERDEFYDLADAMGIMIWHDFMFACAMYPSDQRFLQSVSEEVTDALWRLKSHPSIVLWAGNNENEAALSTNWYNTSAHFKLYEKDYIALYVDTIGKVTAAMDTTRPYLTSSPTNGDESRKEGWVAKNPYDTHFGDTHYYNYDADCMDWTKYPKARFASEYGYQSFSSVETMSSVSLPSDLKWNSSFMVQRNHHADGNNQILQQILRHFNVTSAKTGEELFENLVYLSQIMQSLCYKSETEFYRRSRSEIVRGEGHTMGALYWQLNDVWPTTSWSSIEYAGKWKAVHYFAKQFFANVALSAYADRGVLHIYSLSDINTSADSVTLMLELHLWGEYDKIHHWKFSVDIAAQSSALIFYENIDNLFKDGGCKQKADCYLAIYVKEMPEVSPTYFYPVPFKNVVGLKEANIQVEEVMSLPLKSASPPTVIGEYRISLTSSAPAFFVLLEARNIKGRFSTNAFHITAKTATVIFYSWEITSSAALKSSLHIKSLADASLGDNVALEPVKIQSMHPAIHLPTSFTFTQPVIWLDGVQAQLAFGVCGVMFLLFVAVLLVCVIMKFSNPQLIQPGTSPSPMQLQKKRGCTNVGLHLMDEYSELTDSNAAFLLKLRDPSRSDNEGVNVMFYIQ